MKFAEAFRIANERRVASGRPVITVVQSKDSDEYREVYKIAHEHIYERIHRSMAMAAHSKHAVEIAKVKLDAEEKLRIRREA
jgi:hypothetical protein